MKKRSTPNSAIIHICQELHERSLVSAYGGNVSIRMPNKIIITPKGSSLSELTEDDLVVIDIDGDVLFSTHEPSSEVLLHLNIYKNRPDVHAIIHTHPQMVTSFAYRNTPIKMLTRESRTYLKEVPIVPYYPSGSKELAEAVSPYIKDHDAIMLENHGLVTVGQDIYKAYNLAELTEETAMMNFYVKMLSLS